MSIHTMTDLQLAEYLGLLYDKRWPEAVAKIEPKKRALYERMARVEMELRLWQKGLGPKPKDVIVCREHR